VLSGGGRVPEMAASHQGRNLQIKSRPQVAHRPAFHQTSARDDRQTHEHSAQQRWLCHEVDELFREPANL